MRIKQFAAIAALGALAVTSSATDAVASSHREAPFIAKMPKVDGTDFYMFQSYEATRTGYTTLIANYQPIQNQYGGPNFYTMDPDALYEIHIDNTGDSVEDITFQFRFNNRLNDATGDVGGILATQSIPLANSGVVDINDANRNVLETFTVKMLKGPRRAPTSTGDVTRVSGPGGTDTKVFAKPLDNLGTKSFGTQSYNAYANQFIFPVTIPGCTQQGKIFVGQRAEGFAVNLGAIFDLINASVTNLTLATGGGTVVNSPPNLAGVSVTSIAMEVPTSCLVKDAANPVIGGWTTASVRQARVVNPAGTFTKPSREGGAWVQVSRLGMPLVNEVVIGLKDKNKFNGSEPKDDLANFGGYVTNSVLAKLIEALFGPGAPATAPTTAGRPDLVAAFVTGVPNANQVPNGANGALVPGEMLRLNTAVATKTRTQQVTAWSPNTSL